MDHLSLSWIGVAVSIIALELVWVALVLRRQRRRRGAEPLGPEAFQRELKRILPTTRSDAAEVVASRSAP